MSGNLDLATVYKGAFPFSTPHHPAALSFKFVLCKSPQEILQSDSQSWAYWISEQ